MIIKGGSRGAPGQLAWHLQRRDTNETVSILELQSPHESLGEAFRDWQVLVEGTRGAKGLYHANIDPAQGYVMTREQWQRAVEVLEGELGLDGQPRAIVMHEKHGRQHIHVVWARTDIDRMVVRTDSQNYLAHERASQKLELEFGHAPVPGKHAKRDRKKQPEFPRAEANQSEWQEGERTGLDPAARKDRMTALRQACDTGQAFKTALEGEGYVLANGNRGYVVVDAGGNVHALGRQIRDLKAAGVRTFMADVPLDDLPAAQEAKSLQQQRRREATAAKQAESPTPEDPQSAALRAAVAERNATERQRLEETQAAELLRAREGLDADIRSKMEALVARQRAEAEARRDRERPGFFGSMFRAVGDFFFPARAAERQRAEDARAEEERQARESYAAELRQGSQLELEGLSERHAFQLSKHTAREAEELERYLREQEAARDLQAEHEKREEALAHERDPEGPERPPPQRAR